ncbi:hypothetical protein IWZ00DRAFT_63405 [Phyllosticta capitalensis]
MGNRSWEMDEEEQEQERRNMPAENDAELSGLFQAITPELYLSLPEPVRQQVQASYRALYIHGTQLDNQMPTNLSQEYGQDVPVTHGEQEQWQPGPRYMYPSPEPFQLVNPRPQQAPQQVGQQPYRNSLDNADPPYFTQPPADNHQQPSSTFDSEFLRGADNRAAFTDEQAPPLSPGLQSGDQHQHQHQHSHSLGHYNGPTQPPQTQVNAAPLPVGRGPRYLSSARLAPVTAAAAQELWDKNHYRSNSPSNAPPGPGAADPPPPPPEGRFIRAVLAPGTSNGSIVIARCKGCRKNGKTCNAHFVWPCPRCSNRTCEVDRNTRFVAVRIHPNGFNLDRGYRIREIDGRAYTDGAALQRQLQQLVETPEEQEEETEEGNKEDMEE